MVLVRRAKKGAVPVVMLAGFLGAGKTTILNHILRSAAGARVAVIVNDFGAINIDALLVTASTDRRLELTNGCICCATDGGELEETLEMALEANPDVVIIEASGLAEPEDMARLVTLSPNTQIGYGGLVYVVDAVNYHETRRKHPRIDEHIALADLVAITKLEQVSGRQVNNLLAELSGKTTSPVVPVSNGELAPEVLFDIPKRSQAQLSLLQQGHEREHMHDTYQSVMFESTAPLAPEKFKTFMNQLPRGVYRVKGVIYFGVAGYEQKFVVQAVGRKWDMYAEGWDEQETPRTTLVLIGTGFSEGDVLEMLRDAVGESDKLLDIQRYTDGGA